MDLERLKLAKTVKPKKSRDKVKSSFTFYQFAKWSPVNKKAEETLFNLLRRSLLFFSFVFMLWQYVHNSL